MNELRSGAPWVALLLLAVFVMPATLSVLTPLDHSAILPEDMDSTPDIVLVSIPASLLRWQPPVRLVAPPPERKSPRLHAAKVDLFELDCTLIC